MTVVLILVLSIIFFPILVWQTFKSAGYKGIYSVVPFYNYFIWLKIVNKPLWWYIFLLIPYINVFVVMLLVVETLKCYNINSLGHQALSVIFPFIYLPILGAEKIKKYVGATNRIKIKKSVLREWIDAIIFAVIAASIIRMFMFEAYTIPTPSMEKTLLVGDFLFVSKMAYGPKVPTTPLSFPFVHNTMPLSKSAKSYLEWIKLPYYRFPSFKKVKNNDVVVFNYPDGDTVAVNFQDHSFYALLRDYGRNRVFNEKNRFGEIYSRPVDKRLNYIKRCIAIPGDTLQIIDQIVYINSKKVEQPENAQFKYFITTDGTMINPKIIEDNDISNDFGMVGQNQLVMTLTEKSAKKLKTFSGVTNVEQIIQPKGYWQPYIFPFDSNYAWNVDNYGPIVMPKKGVTIDINLKNIVLYRRVIEAYENNSFEIKGNEIIINGKPSKQYTFKMDYYWMMGDNRHNSADSRFWGFVPIDHIVGKASFVWLSLNNNKSLLGGKIRFNKIFRNIK